MRFEDIELHVGDVDRAYAELGPVHAKQSRHSYNQGAPQLADINGKLRMEAAQLGADAVVGIEYKKGGVSLTAWSSLEATGTAVKWSARVAGPIPPRGEHDVTSLLSALSSLRDAGVLTDAEFQAKKTELLARI